MGKDKRQSPSTLLWFIRHKSYVPISEIRRRFYVDADEGTFIDTGSQRRTFVGLPAGTALSLQKLWQQGKIGLEYSVEFDANVLIGVYPMNPSKEQLNGNGFYPPARPRIAPIDIGAAPNGGPVDQFDHPVEIEGDSTADPIHDMPLVVPHDLAGQMTNGAAEYADEAKYGGEITEE